MEINIKSTKAIYGQDPKNVREVWFKPHENGIVEVTDPHDSYIWDAIDHLIGANPHLIPMSMTEERHYGGIKIVILFVEKSVFGHQSPNVD